MNNSIGVSWQYTSRVSNFAVNGYTNPILHTMRTVSWSLPLSLTIQRRSSALKSIIRSANCSSLMPALSCRLSVSTGSRTPRKAMDVLYGAVESARFVDVVEECTALACGKCIEPFIGAEAGAAGTPQLAAAGVLALSLLQRVRDCLCHPLVQADMPLRRSLGDLAVDFRTDADVETP